MHQWLDHQDFAQQKSIIFHEHNVPDVVKEHLEIWNTNLFFKNLASQAYIFVFACFEMNTASERCVQLYTKLLEKQIHVHLFACVGPAVEAAMSGIHGNARSVTSHAHQPRHSDERSHHDRRRTVRARQHTPRERNAKGNIFCWYMLLACTFSHVYAIPAKQIDHSCAVRELHTE
jgi:hypothetical protein